MKKLLLLIMGICMLGISSVAFADSNVTLVYNPNLESDLAGYRLYNSTTSGGQVLREGDEIAEILAGSNTVTVMLPVGDNHLVLTAYDITGNESGASNEVYFNAPAPDTAPPSDPTGLTITATVHIVVEIPE